MFYRQYAQGLGTGEDEERSLSPVFRYLAMFRQGAPEQWGSR